MVHDIAVDADGVATVHIALTTLGCPLQAEIRREIAVEGRRACPASPT